MQFDGKSGGTCSSSIKPQPLVTCVSRERPTHSPLSTTFSRSPTSGGNSCTSIYVALIFNCHRMRRNQLARTNPSATPFDDFDLELGCPAPHCKVAPYVLRRTLKTFSAPIALDTARNLEFAGRHSAAERCFPLSRPRLSCLCNRHR